MSPVAHMPGTVVWPSSLTWAAPSRRVVEALHVGDIVLVRPGERVPADGDLAEGAGSVDELMLTGEPMPRDKRPGDELTGGAVHGPTPPVLPGARPRPHAVPRPSIALP